MQYIKLELEGIQICSFRLRNGYISVPLQYTMDTISSRLSSPSTLLHSFWAGGLAGVLSWQVNGYYLLCVTSYYLWFSLCDLLLFPVSYVYPTTYLTPTNINEWKIP